VKERSIESSCIQCSCSVPAGKTRGLLGMAVPLWCGVFLICGTAQGQSPKAVCHTDTDVWGTPAAVTATPGPVNSKAPGGYFVAAIADEAGYLEVKAFQDNCKEVGHVHTDLPVPVGAPIMAVAAADLDGNQIVTAVVDQTGTLEVQPWTVGGSGGIAPITDASLTAADTANPNGTTPFLGITALSPTTVVTAYQDDTSAENLVLQQWNIPSGGKPAPVGTPFNLGSAIKKLCTTASGAPIQATFGEPSKIAIATVSPSMFITAASDINNNLYVDVWSVGADGTFGTSGQYCVPDIVNGANPGLAIATGEGYINQKVDGIYLPEIQYYAVTPLINSVQNFEVLYWNISAAGAISKTGDIKDTSIASALPTASAGAVLSTGVPMSAFLQQSGDNFDVNVGWYGRTGEQTFIENTIETTKTGTNGAGVFSVSAAEAGVNFPSFLPVGTAYFVTGTVTADNGNPPTVADPPYTPANPGEFKLVLWSYPVVLDL
jgi:hypothetical protein